MTATPCDHHARQASILDPFTNEIRWVCEGCGADCGARTDAAPAAPEGPAKVWTFEVGGTYEAGGGSDYVWTFRVLKRTAKFVTIQDMQTGDTRRVGVKVSTYGGRTYEWALPLGSYSLAPVMSAEPSEVE